MSYPVRRPSPYYLPLRACGSSVRHPCPWTMALIPIEHFHPPSTLQRGPDCLIPVLDTSPAWPVPWVKSTELPPQITPLVVTIKEGETLFLPAGWWHRVEQQEGSGGLAVAVN